VKTKKVLLLSFFTILFWAYFNQASAALSVQTTAALDTAPIMADFVAPNLTLDCNNTEATIAVMKTEYAAGIDQMKTYFLMVSKASAQWYGVLSPSAGQTVNFPVGQFAPLSASSSNIMASSKKMWAWLEDFNDKFSVFSDGFAKCAKNKNKKVQIEEAFAKFFEMSSDSLGVTVSMFEHGARQMKQWSAAWTPYEGQNVMIEDEKFEPILNLSNNMIEAERLVQENADLALAELDIITDEGAPNGRSSNNRAIQLFYR
jgi:hypothetical protein